jgi:hypothetical protein
MMIFLTKKRQQKNQTHLQKTIYVTCYAGRLMYGKTMINCKEMSI